MRIPRILAVVALVAAACVAADAEKPNEETFRKPTPEEALRFLRSLPPVARMHAKGYWVRQYDDFTVEDLKTCKVLHPGGHVQDPRNPKKTNTPHLYLYPWDWKYFTVFEGLESFEAYHDIEGIDDSCFFYLGQLPSKTMRKILIGIAGKANGDGVKHLQNLENLESLTIKFSRDITDIALEHAGGIKSLQYLDVNGCPLITGSGVRHLARSEEPEDPQDRRMLAHRRVARALQDAVHRGTGSFGQREALGGALPGRRTAPVHGVVQWTEGASWRIKTTCPRLKKLYLKGTRISKGQMAQLEKLRPGLEVK